MEALRKLDMDYTGLDYNKEFEATFYAWRESHKLAQIDVDMLPDHGLVVLLNSIPMVMAWLFDPSGKICYFDFGVSNPDVREGRDECVELMIDSLELKAKDLGYELVSTYTDIPRLAKRYIDRGWFESKPIMNNLIRVL